MRQYGRIERSLRASDESAIFLSQVPPHVCMRLKKIFPKIKATAVQPFILSELPDICADLLWFLERYPMQVSTRDHAAIVHQANAYKATQAELERIQLPGWRLDNLPGLKPGMALRDYQQRAVGVAANVEALLLGDDIGLGKTYEAIGMLLLPGSLPAAVVMQTHLQQQWAEKVAEFSTLTTHRIKKATPYDLPPADVYLFKYSQLAGWVDLFQTEFFKVAVFDEVQELRTGTKSQKGQAAKELCANAVKRIGLTATPVYNYGIELFNITDILHPGLLGTQMEFVIEWCGYNWKSVSDPAALGSYMRDINFFLRRTKADVGQDMENVNSIVESVGHDAKEADQATEIAKQLSIRSLTGSFVERGSAARELDMLVRQVTGVSKAKYVAEFVKILLENGEPTILAGWHREVYDIWLDELKEYRPVMYTGSESPRQKELAKKAFVNGDTNLFILSLRSGAGLDGLQHRCSTVVFGELDWSPKMHEQLIGRVDREGQTKPVMALYLVSDFGSDPVIVDLLGLKAAQADGIADPGIKRSIKPADDSRLKTLALSFLSEKERLQLKHANAPAVPA